MPRRRLFKKPDTWEYGHDAPADEKPLAKPGKRRVATLLVYSAMFFAGAAFAAVAGDRFTQMSAESNAADATSSDTTSTTDTTAAASLGDAAAPAAAAPADAAPAPDAAVSAAAATGGSSSSNAAPSAQDAAAADAASSSPDSSSGPDYLTSKAPKSAGGGSAAQAASAGPTSTAKAIARKTAHARQLATRVVLLPAETPAPPPELEGPAANATIWLNRALPDPTPPALRLSPLFAHRLTSAAESAGINWSLLLGILRAKGVTGRNPADLETLLRLGNRLGDLQKNADSDWATALAYDGSSDFADKALALARYDRAVGLNALVNGLESAKTNIAQRILDDPAISIYAGGRSDIANGKVDVRVLVMIEYLHEAFGQVTVSCLISGHRLYARPGVISAHIFGRAVDIAALGSTPILGHQDPGSITEQAVRDILQLPAEVMPKQVISLLGLGGPSFPLADHFNHIHIGY